MEKANKFFDGMNKLDPVAANKALTNNNYSKDAALKLAADIMETLRPHIEKNKDLLNNWDASDYETRKKYVRETLSILLKKYPSPTIKPEIYFKEDIAKLNKNNAPVPPISACFFDTTFVPSQAQIACQITGDDKPFFAFFHDFSGRGIMGQIVHEFTHYLQAAHISSIKPNVVEQAGKYYKLANENAQINRESIFEVEANGIGDYARQQTVQLLRGVDLSVIKQMQNQND